MIDESCEAQILTGLSVFESTLKQLVDGRITISDLRIVIQQQTQVIDLYKVVESASKETILPQPADKNITKAQMLIKVVQQRKKELDAFLDLKLQLENFITLCKDMKKGI